MLKTLLAVTIAGLELVDILKIGGVALGIIILVKGMCTSSGGGNNNGGGGNSKGNNNNNAASSNNNNSQSNGQ